MCLQTPVAAHTVSIAGKQVAACTGGFSFKDYRGTTLEQAVAQIRADFEHGELIIHVPKPALPQPRKVQISAGNVGGNGASTGASTTAQSPSAQNTSGQSTSGQSPSGQSTAVQNAGETPVGVGAPR